jgi:exonuclease III
MNETKIDQNKFSELGDFQYFSKDYNQYYNFCKPPFSGYSGVSIFSKVLPISIKEDLGIFAHDQEGRILTMEFSTFFLISSYIPNAGDKCKRLEYKT